ncbi:MAG: BlaI family penicillinase repressor [Chlamydiales bacterium]|jgi:BlaI family penicillinase repressor
MTPKRLHELGALQREVLEILWRLERASVAEVRAALSRPTPAAYTTVLSVLQKLEQQGWVEHQREGRSYVYSAARSREKEGRRSLRQLVEGVFDSDPMAAFQNLLSDSELDESDLDSLQQMIDAKQKEIEDAR